MQYKRVDLESRHDKVPGVKGLLTLFGDMDNRFLISQEAKHILLELEHGLKFSANAYDDEVAHEIAVALAEASQRGGSPQVSGTPTKRREGVKSSTFRHIKIKESIVDVHGALASDTNEEDLLESTEADTGELSMQERDVMDSVSGARTRPKVRSLDGKIIEVYNKSVNHMDGMKEECSGTKYKCIEKVLYASVT